MRHFSSCFLVAFSISCVESKSTDSGDTLLAPSIDACTPPTPRTDSGVLAGTITSDARVVSFAWTAPADALAGVATFEVLTPVLSESVVPALSFSHDATLYGNGDLALPDDPHVTFAVAVAPGETISVTYEDYVWTTEDAYPYAFSIGWSWEQRDDCYEPDSVLADAQSISLNENHEAWMFFSVGDAFPGTEVDNFSFVLEEERTVTVNLSATPALAQAASLRVEGSDEVLHSAISENGTLAFTPEAPLAAGTWVLTIEPFTSRPKDDNPDQPGVGEMWSPYTFSVTTP